MSSLYFPQKFAGKNAKQVSMGATVSMACGWQAAMPLAASSSGVRGQAKGETAMVSYILDAQHSSIGHEVMTHICQ